MVLANFLGTFLQFASIVDLFYEWDRIGFFDIVLPFLLIFSIVFGALTTMKLFDKQRGVQIIISLVLGLLAVRFPFLSNFLAVLTPKLGIGLMVLLAVLLLAGMFTPEKGRGVVGWVLMTIGVIIFIIILVQTFDVLGSFGAGQFLNSQFTAYLLMIVALIGVIIVVTIANGKRDPNNAVEKIVSLFGK